MKKILTILALGMFIAMAATSVYAYEATQGPTELIVYDQAQAYNGYNVFTSLTQSPPYQTYMIDMEGNIVHVWEYDSSTVPFYGYLLESGNLLNEVNPPGADEADVNGLLSGGGAAGRVQETDWDNNVVWSVDYWSSTYRQHHDFQRIWNTRINAYTNIFIAWETRTREEGEAKGGDPQWGNYEDGWSPCTIVEMDMDGNVIWIWRFFDHLVSDFDPATANFGDPTAPENWGKLDANVRNNLGVPGLRPDFNHCNSLDYNAELDQICINSREHGEFFVVDHSLTTEEAATAQGDFVYRWGDPANYGQGTAPTFNDPGNEQLFGAHDIQWIRPGLQGAGNFLVFENAIFRPQFVTKSLIFEINAFLDAEGNDTGDYVWQQDVGYHGIFGNPPSFFNLVSGVSDQVVWAYVPNNSDMWSPYISGAQRLPNGNTLMCAGEEANFVEVTPAGQIVWNYVSPRYGGGVTQVMEGGMNNSVFRVYRYGPDFPGLIGQDLTPQGPITNSTFEGAMGNFQDASEARSGGVTGAYYRPRG
jgi:hypothetical protein